MKSNNRVLAIAKKLKYHAAKAGGVSASAARQDVAHKLKYHAAKAGGVSSPAGRQGVAHKLNNHAAKAGGVAILLLIITMCGLRTPAQNDSQPSDTQHRTIIARSGDTIAKIAKRTGIDSAEIAKLNNLSEKSRVRKG